MWSIHHYQLRPNKTSAPTKQSEAAFQTGMMNNLRHFYQPHPMLPPYYGQSGSPAPFGPPSPAHFPQAGFIPPQLSPGQYPGFIPTPLGLGVQASAGELPGSLHHIPPRKINPTPTRENELGNQLIGRNTICSSSSQPVPIFTTGLCFQTEPRIISASQPTRDRSNSLELSKSGQNSDTGIAQSSSPNPPALPNSLCFQTEPWIVSTSQPTRDRSNSLKLSKSSQNSDTGIAQSNSHNPPGLHSSLGFQTEPQIVSASQPTRDRSNSLKLSKSNQNSDTGIAQSSSPNPPALHSSLHFQTEPQIVSASQPTRDRSNSLELSKSGQNSDTGIAQSSNPNPPALHSSLHFQTEPQIVSASQPTRDRSNSLELSKSSQNSDTGIAQSSSPNPPALHSSLHFQTEPQIVSASQPTRDRSNSLELSNSSQNSDTGTAQSSNPNPPALHSSLHFQTEPQIVSASQPTRDRSNSLELSKSSQNLDTGIAQFSSPNIVALLNSGSHDNQSNSLICQPGLIQHSNTLNEVRVAISSSALAIGPSSHSSSINRSSTPSAPQGSPGRSPAQAADKRESDTVLGNEIKHTQSGYSSDKGTPNTRPRESEQASSGGSTPSSHDGAETPKQTKKVTEINWTGISHDDYVFDDPYGKYYCRKCIYVTRRLDKMAQHLRAHLAGRFKCDICGKAFIKTCDMERHANAHKNNRVRPTKGPNLFGFDSNLGCPPGPSSLVQPVQLSSACTSTAPSTSVFPEREEGGQPWCAGGGGSATVSGENTYLMSGTSALAVVMASQAVTYSSPPHSSAPQRGQHVVSSPQAVNPWPTIVSARLPSFPLTFKAKSSPSRQAGKSGGEGGVAEGNGHMSTIDGLLKMVLCDPPTQNAPDHAANYENEKVTSVHAISETSCRLNSATRDTRHPPNSADRRQVAASVDNASLGPIYSTGNGAFSPRTSVIYKTGASLMSPDNAKQEPSVREAVVSGVTTIVSLVENIHNKKRRLQKLNGDHDSLPESNSKDKREEMGRIFSTGAPPGPSRVNESECSSSTMSQALASPGTCTAVPNLLMGAIPCVSQGAPHSSDYVERQPVSVLGSGRDAWPQPGERIGYSSAPVPPLPPPALPAPQPMASASVYPSGGSDQVPGPSHIDPLAVAARHLCCTLCNYSTRDTWHLQKHLLAHGQGSNTCKYCGKAFERLSDLTRHEERHTDRAKEPSSQPLAPVPSSSLQKRPRPAEEAFYQCDLCISKFTSIDSLNDHKEKEHTPIFVRVDEYSAGILFSTHIVQCELGPSKNEITLGTMPTVSDVTTSGRPVPSVSCLMDIELITAKFKEAPEIDRDALTAQGEAILTREQTRQPTLLQCWQTEDASLGKEAGPSQDSGEGIETTSTTFPQHHPRHVRPVDALYRCSLCNYATNTHSHWSKHEEAHKGRYICKICGKAFKKTSDLTRHWVGHETIPGSPYIACDSCPFRTLKKQVMERHMRGHYLVFVRSNKNHQNSNEPPYTDSTGGQKTTCLLQDNSFGEQDYGLPDVRDLENSADTPGPSHCTNTVTAVSGIDQTGFECSYCGKEFQSHDRLLHHESLHRAAPDDTVATHLVLNGSNNGLGQTFESEENPWSPTLGLGLCKEESDLEPAFFECKYCGKEFQSRDNLQQHERLHIATRTFQTNDSEAPGNPSTRSSKREYQKRKSGRHVCKHCGKKFLRAGNLTNHMLFHFSGRDAPSRGPTECPICSKVVSSGTYLKEHLKLHTERTPFVCNRCGANYKSKLGLKNHRKRCRVTTTKPTASS